VDRLEAVDRVPRIPDVSLVDLSRDGAWLVFVSNLTGFYQLWTLRLSDNFVNQVSHGDQLVTYARISSHSKHVYFLPDFYGTEKHQLFEA